MLDVELLQEIKPGTDARRRLVFHHQDMFSTGLALRENKQYALCATGADDCIHFMMSEFFSAVNNIWSLLNAHPAKVVESQAFADTFPARFVRTLYHLIRQDRKPIKANVVIECSLTDSHVNAILNEALTCGGDGLFAVDDELLELCYQCMVATDLEIRALSRHVLRVPFGGKVG